jgi:hypothetical protein
MFVHMGGRDRRMEFEARLGHVVGPCLKITTKNQKNHPRVGDNGSVVDYFPSMHKTLGLIPSTTKRASE